MERKVITNNKVDKLTVKWDGVRFGIVSGLGYGDDVVILNPREAQEVEDFIHENNGEYRRELQEEKLLENIGRLEG